MNTSQTSGSTGITHILQLNQKNTENGPKDQKTGRFQPQPVLTAPFLQYTTLTPGQKRYLRVVGNAYSEAHMRKLMQQHYLNVLRRSIRAGTGNFIWNMEPRTIPADLGDGSRQDKESVEGKGQKDLSTSKTMSVLPENNSQQKRKHPAKGQ